MDDTARMATTSRRPPCDERGACDLPGRPCVTTASGAGSCGIAVMAKASAPGRTKTRLAPGIGQEGAARLNTTFLQDIAANLLLASRSVPVAPYMAFGPPGSEPFFGSILPDGIGLIETWLGSFGDCLLHATTELFARGHAAACVLNSDSPTLPTAILVELASRLSLPGDRAVLGPSHDGGYYVLGLKAPHRHLFEDIAWSTEAVAGQTLERAREIGLEVHVLPAWYDVDDDETLGFLERELFEGWSFGGAALAPYPALQTRAMLAALGRDGMARPIGSAEAGMAAGSAEGGITAGAAEVGIAAGAAA